MMGSTCVETFAQPLLTDLYQVTMAYAYWKSGKMNEEAVFDLFFRKNPFKGEFTIFAGLSDCLNFLDTFHFSESDISYLRTILPPSCEEEFFSYLANLRPEGVRVEALLEGSVCFPRVPLIKVTGPLIMVQLLETAFLNLVNYASLVTTNAARFRIAAGNKTKLYEFGLRRAQGPNGGLSASKYSYLGGFDGTSNVLAGKLFGIPVAGTLAHSYVNSFSSLDQVHNLTPAPLHIELESSTTLPLNSLNSKLEISTLLPNNLDPPIECWTDRCRLIRKQLARELDLAEGEASEGELAAFISFASAFPSAFLVLLDTYDVVRSGLLNFCTVALALHQLGYRALGARIDSGDLAYLSIKVREVFRLVAATYELPWFADLEITASNDINEETILSMNEQGHAISSYGVGTHLVTCQRQPALGCVYKLVSLEGDARMKLSQDKEKVTMPGGKVAYRLFGKEGLAILDLMQMPSEQAPVVGKKVLCRHPFEESRRAWVTPLRVEILHQEVWPRQQDLQGLTGSGYLKQVKKRVEQSMKTLRADHVRSLNPTPYKVSVSDQLYSFIHELWLANAPIGELS